MGSQPSLIVLFTLLYAGFGSLSPFLPPLLQSRGLPPEVIGAIIGAGVIVRMAVTPALGRVADGRHAVCQALAGACLCSALVAALYAAPLGGTALIILVLAQAAALAPTAPFADASAVSAAARGGFSYGRIRGFGSAAFILGSLGAGVLAERFGSAAPALAQAALIALAALAALRAPEPAQSGGARNANAPMVGSVRKPRFSVRRRHSCACARQPCAARRLRDDLLGQGGHFAIDRRRALVGKCRVGSAGVPFWPALGYCDRSASAAHLLWRLALRFCAGA